MAAAGLTEPRCASERGLAMGGGRPAERRFTVGGSGKSVARCHRTVLAYWKFESISLQRRVRCEPDLLERLLTERPGSDHYGELQAWDPATGKKAWQHNFRWQLMATVLATGGDLVFIGGTNDRMFRAFDAKTGDLLWEQKTNSGITGAPVAYEVDGTEYIAVQSGWGVDAERIQDKMAKANIGVSDNVPQGGVVWVFKVKQP